MTAQEAEAAGGDRSRWDGMALTLEGLASYRPTWELQRALWERRRRLTLPDLLLLLEHEPVITLGRHGDPRHLLLASGGEGAPAADHPEVVRVDRGGEVTYHGPGQLTAYWICDLRAHALGVRQFVERLEQAVIETLAAFAIRGFRRAGLIGVWTETPAGPTKIAAIGVRIARGVSLHGLALNVDARCLEGFRWMVPCGLEGAQLTSMEQQSDRPVAMAEVRAALTQRIGALFDVDLRPQPLGAVHQAADLEPHLARIERTALRGARKPDWLRIELPRGAGFARVRRVLQHGALSTVCESARCPNRQECWSAGTATFMILGDRCTRHCRFCAVLKGGAGPPDPAEPERVARAAAQLGLRHVVITSVTRDDLPGGGARRFAATITAVKERLPGVSVEVLVPDFGGSAEALAVVLAAAPAVLNHNVETVPRLYPLVRPGADYQRSLALLRRAAVAGVAAKSGFMVGLGESETEILHLLADLHQAGCRRVTIGQYLQPDRDCLPVKRYWTPGEFAAWRARARALGFVQVDAGPLVRSSYHAAESWAASGSRPARE